MIDASVVKKIIIKISSNNNLTLFWSRDEEGLFNENNSISTEIKNDGACREYTLDLSKHSNWYGIVHRLRINPKGKGDVTEFGIDYIRFAPQWLSCWTVFPIQLKSCTILLAKFFFFSFHVLNPKKKDIDFELYSYIRYLETLRDSLHQILSRDRIENYSLQKYVHEK